MVKLKNILLTNFLSHKKTEIEFGENQQLLIDGKSGSGKSAIVEAIVWALYGVGRADNRALIHRGAKTAKVALTLVDGKKEYLIERGITGSGKHKFEISDKEGDGEFVPIASAGLKNKQEFLWKDILRCSYLLFINSVVYPQENTESFVHQTATKRKDLLMEIVNAGSFDEYYLEVCDYLRDKKEGVAGIDGGIATMKSNIQYDEEKIADKAETEELVKKATSLRKKSLKTYTDLTAIQAQDEKVKNGIRIRNQEISNVNVQLQRRDVENKQHNAEIVFFNDKSYELPADFDKNYADAKTELLLIEGKQAELMSWNEKNMALLTQKPAEIDYKSQIEALNKKIMDKLNAPIENCPEIDKTCPILVKERDSDVEKMSAELQELSTQEEEKVKKVNIFANQIADLGEKPDVDSAKKQELNSLLNSLDEAKRKSEEGSSDKEKVAVLNSKIEENIKIISELRSKRDVYVAENTQDEAQLKGSPELETQIMEANMELTQLDTDLDRKKGLLAIMAESEKRLELSKKELKQFEDKKKKILADTEEMQLLKEAFGNNGLKAIVTDYVVPKLEDRINDILHRVSDFTIRLDTQKTGLSKGTTLEGLFINIFNEAGEEFDYNNYSGGEKLKITVAISEALAELQTVGFRVLDELFVGLDDESTQGFAEVMATLQNRFSQLLCISHLPNIKDAFAERLTVVKQNGVSKIL